MHDKTKHLSLAMRLGVDFISGIVVGTLIGKGFDEYFATYPWGLVIFMVLGIMAGSLNVYRLLRDDCFTKKETNL